MSRPAVIVLVFVLCALVVGAVVQLLTPADAQTITTRIVSTSGIPHHDVGNYTKSSFWEPGDPRGIPDSNSWRASIDHVLGRLANEGADSYLHVGDMVSGRWGLDKDRPKAGIFGPTDTLAEKERAVTRAGDLYYRQNKSWWTANGIPTNRVHFAMGDHEYGNTNPDGVPRPDQLSFLNEHRDIWRKHFSDGRGYMRAATGQQRHGSYATVLPGGVGLVTLDPILSKDGKLIARIGGEQERWLITTLAQLNARPDVRKIFVQVEIPPLGPNRSFHSGDQTLQNGNRIWDIIDAANVDLVLSAEWHEITTRERSGTVQIVHGSQLYQGRANWLVIDVLGNGQIHVTARRLTGVTDNTDKMWAPHDLRAPNEVVINGSPETVGTLTLDGSGDLVNASGALEVFNG